MDVDKARKHEAAFGIKRAPFRRAMRAQAGDAAMMTNNVGGHQSLTRQEAEPAADHQFVPKPCIEHHRSVSIVHREVADLHDSVMKRAEAFFATTGSNDYEA